MSVEVAGPVELSGITVGEPSTVVAPSGGGSPITSYMHVQELPATVWTVHHNLDRYPAAVSVFSDDLTTQWSEFGVLHIDTNSLYITADIAISGKALVE
jgi:hypothetical protein